MVGNTSDKHGILEAMFFSFLNSNHHNGKRFSVEELLQLHNNMKLYFKFRHGSSPYLAQAKMKNFIDGPQLVIKLPNLGFNHLPTEGRCVTRQDSNAWFDLHDSVHKYFGGALGQFPEHKTARLFHNARTRQADVMLDAGRTAHGRLPSVLITYTPSSPYLDDDDAYAELIH